MGDKAEKKLRKKERKFRKKKMRKLRVLKLVTWLGIVGLFVGYHYFWVNSVMSIQIQMGDGNGSSGAPMAALSWGMNSRQYDPNQTNGDEYNNGDGDDGGDNPFGAIEELMGGVMDPEAMANWNISEAFNDVTTNQTLVAQLAQYIGPNPTPEQVLAALGNATIPRNLIQPFYESFWRDQMVDAVPPQWEEPISVGIGYNGSVAVKNLAVYVDSEVGDHRNRLATENLTTLPSGGTFNISITLAEAFTGFIQAQYEFLANATYEAAVSGNPHFMDMLAMNIFWALGNASFFLHIGVEAQVGWYPLELQASVNMTSFMSMMEGGGEGGQDGQQGPRASNIECELAALNWPDFTGVTQGTLAYDRLRYAGGWS